MEKRNKSGGAAFLKKLFLKNLGIKIVALVFATILWGVVLTVKNPDRIKVLANVPVSFEGNSDLLNRNLVVRGNPLKELGNITVRVRTPITNYMQLNADQVSAYVSLNKVTAPGKWSLPVYAEATVGRNDTRAEAWTPDKVTVEIDTLQSKPVPVEPYYEGTVPDGYWAASAELSRSYVDIRGPKQDVERVSRAICKIQMTDRRQSYNDAVAVTLLDAGGNEMDSALFLGTPPSVTVKMAVSPKKTVPIDVTGSLLGADNLPSNYQIFACDATPETADIIGDAQTLASISSLTLSGLDVAGKKESIHQKAALNVPQGVTVLGNVTEAEVFVDIREKTSKQSFEAVPIQIRSLGNRLKATLSMETTNISVEGRVSLVDLLNRNDVQAFVNLNGLKEGVYNLNVSIYLRDDETTLELTSASSVGTVTVTIAKK